MWKLFVAGFILIGLSFLVLEGIALWIFVSLGWGMVHFFAWRQHWRDCIQDRDFERALERKRQGLHP